MPRDKKFNKRGGGKRLDAQSAEEIEQRNQRLEEFEAARQARREEEEGSDEDGEKGGEEAKDDDATPPAGSAKPKAKPPAAPAQVTTEADHKRNMAKLEEVKRRRAEAEAKRKLQEEAELALEMERKAKVSQLQNEDEEGDGGKKKKKKEKQIPKLTKIEIKKMKPAQMKEGKFERLAELDALDSVCPERIETNSPLSQFLAPTALKERGLDIQGNAKTLTKRLVDYEEAR